MQRVGLQSMAALGTMRVANVGRVVLPCLRSFEPPTRSAPLRQAIAAARCWIVRAQPLGSTLPSTRSQVGAAAGLSF